MNIRQYVFRKNMAKNIFTSFNMANVEKIMHINSVNSTNFNGIHVATLSNKANNSVFDLNVYKIVPSDKPFLDIMQDNIHLGVLTKGISRDGLEKWHTIIKRAVDMSVSPMRSVHLLAKDKKPCGIVACSNSYGNYKIDYIATWPVKSNEKVPLAGKALFRVVFDDFLKSGLLRIDMDAIKDGPYDCIAKYMRLGFKSMGGGNFIEKMRATSEDVKKSVSMLDNLLIFKKTGETKDLNLFSVLKASER